MKNFVNRNSLLLFFLLAFAISWIGILLSFGQQGLHSIKGEEVLEGEFPRQLVLIWLCMLAGPSISGILLSVMTGGKKGLKQLLGSIAKWRVHIKWYCAAIPVFPALLLLVFITLSIISGKYFPSFLFVPGLAVGLIGGFFEEIGWTGFALPRLQSRFGFIKTGILLGVIHATWHFFADYLGSVDLYGELYFFHFFLWILALTALRFLIIWIHNHTGSLLLAQLTHASFTGSQVIFTPAGLKGGETNLWYSSFVLVLVVWVLIMIRSDPGAAKPG
jgi:membrane protease YdiL (CAAX protease family)